MVLFQSVVVVPRLALSAPHLYESNAAFKQPARYQKLTSMRTFAVGFSNVLGFLVEVEGIRCLRLHAKGELECFYAGLELRISRPFLQMARVQGLNEIELFPLLGARKAAVSYVRDELGDVGVLGVEVGALVGSGKKGASPVAGSHHGIAVRAHHDESGQVFVLRTQSIGNP